MNKGKNAVIAAGLNGLLKQPEATPTPDTVTDAQGEKTKGNYKTVCYNIPPAIADYMRYIATYDRKKINAVVSEAFAEYIRNWKPAPQEKPKKFIG